MQDLKLQATLPALSFDFDGLKAWAESITEQYKGLVVQEDQLAGIKSEMAGLNKCKKALDDARKETVRKVSEPIKGFEGQVKEVIAIFDDTYRFLGEQVKAFEDRAREDKRREVQFMIEAVLDEYGINGLDIPIQDSWLNKTTAMKSVKAQVGNIILEHIKVEREKAALEQAKKDRAVFIEDKCAALGKIYGFSLPVSGFLALYSLDIPMQDAAEAIEAAYQKKQQDDVSRAQREAEAKAKHEEMASSTILNQAPQHADEVAAPVQRRAAPVQRRAAAVPRVKMIVEIEFYTTREAEVLAALRGLSGLCIDAQMRRMM